MRETEIEKTVDPGTANERSETETKAARLNPRYLFIDPSSDFGRSFYQDLLMEMQEQM